MNRKSTSEDAEHDLKVIRLQMLVIGILGGGAAIFGSYEGSFFNTYIEHVLGKDFIYIGVMVSVSAIFGLIFVLVFGTLSDNCRSKLGRRRPYMLFGIIAGTAMALYGFSPNYWWCFILDAIIIGVASNGFYAATRPLVPDIIPIEDRGRANSIVTIFGTIGTLIMAGMALFVNEFFSYKEVNEEGNVVTIINQPGHILVLMVGGISIIIVTIIGFIFIKEKKPSDLPPPKKFWEDLSSSFQLEEMKKNKEFFKIIIAMTIFNTGQRLIAPFLFNYIFDLGLDTIAIILAVVIIAPVVVLGTIYMGNFSDKYGRKKLVAPTILISSIGFFMVPFFYPADIFSSLMLVIAVSLVMLTTTCLLVPLGAWQQDLLPEGKKGQFIGILNIISTVSQIPGAILGGMIADAYGVAWIFFFVPFFMIGAIPFFIIVKETLPDKFRKELDII
ncbi:MAG: MFS transporter [Promethearchaeota archaeon]|nr:MAG: MFS transporter [Candidatus Lokiarchaeota archaeon]